MKPGDLVEIIDHGGYYSTDPPRIGLFLRIVGRPGGHAVAQVLEDGNVVRYAIRDIQPVISGHDGYDNNNNKER